MINIEKIHVGVQPVVIQDRKVLLGLRKNNYQAGSWGLPGGKLELNETIFDAVARELLEETGLVATKMRLFGITDPESDKGHHMQIGVEVNGFSGFPEIREPNKCGALQFFGLNDLPVPLFSSSAEVLSLYILGDMHRPAPSRVVGAGQAVGLLSRPTP